MGASQSLPLPARIPQPTKPQQEQLVKLGFTFPESEDENDIYVPVKLPEGFKWHDGSYREDVPNWYVINTERLAILQVTGSWKGTYDNQLYLDIFEQPQMIDLKETVPKRSEMDGPAMLSMALEAGVQETQAGRDMIGRALTMPDDEMPPLPDE